jgi:hypothetical protein
MPKLTDVVDDKTGKFIKAPIMVLQDIIPADDVSASILMHLKYRYQMVSMLSLTIGPHGGRVLLLYNYTGGAVAPGQGPTPAR